MTSHNADRDPIDRLAEEFVDRYRRGERPAVSEYARRHPELAGRIRSLFPAMVMIEEIGASSSGSMAQSVTADGEPLQRLGEYEILREVGRGGMGVVYEARQESLDRHVALKVLPHHALQDAARLDRFQRESRAAAGLHHTNIVPVFGVGQHDGVHYYAMQFIDGRGLDQVLAEIRQVRGPKASSSDAAGRLPGDAERTFSGELREPASVPSGDGHPIVSQMCIEN